MGTIFKYRSSDEVFRNTSNKKIIVNYLDNRTVRDKAAINNLLMLEVGEVFDNVPRCSCGALSMQMFKGVRCSNCDTIVEDVVSVDLDNKMWVKTPEGIPKLMNVKFWHQLQSYLERSSYKFKLLSYLTDPYYQHSLPKLTKSVEAMLNRLDELGLNIKGNYLNFYQNFDTYLKVLLTEKEFKKDPKKYSRKGQDLLELFQENKDIVWQDYIQIPNKALTIVENSNGKKWIDQSTPKLLRAVRLMVGIDNEENVRGGLTLAMKQSRVSKFLSYMGEYYDLEINPKYLGKKPGEIRKHVIATRSNFTARFVVTAITRPHDYDEVVFPWQGFMGVFAPHIRAKLYHKYGYSAKRISEIMTKYQKVYHPEIYKIMRELIDESRAPCGKIGIPCVINRNPSLKQGSIVLLRIVDVKIDVRDLSASTSGTIAALYNGDYDGDQETFLILLDHRTARAFVPFDARYSVSNLINPFVADGVVSLPKQTTMSLGVALTYNQHVTPTQEQLNYMQQFAA